MIPWRPSDAEVFLGEVGLIREISGLYLWDVLGL